jgi:hypothetical protein
VSSGTISEPHLGSRLKFWPSDLENNVILKIYAAEEENTNVRIMSWEI